MDSKKLSSTVSRLDLTSPVNFFGKKIPTPPPFEAPVFSDLHFPKKVCDAVKKLFSILQSVSNQVSVTATNVLMGAVCKKFANSSNLFFKLWQLIRKNKGECFVPLFFRELEYSIKFFRWRPGFNSMSPDNMRRTSEQKTNSFKKK